MSGSQCAALIERLSVSNTQCDALGRGEGEGGFPMNEAVLQYYYSTTTVLLQYCYSTATVRLQYYYSTTTVAEIVPLQYYYGTGSTTTVLLKY